MKLKIVALLFGMVFVIGVNAATNESKAANSVQDQVIAQMRSMQQQQMQMQSKMLENEESMLQNKRNPWHPEDSRPIPGPDQDYDYYHSRAKSLRWVRGYDGDVPYGAVVAGHSRGWPIYICHTNYRDGVETGQVVRDGCLVSYAGKAFVISDYQVLTGKRKVFWVPSIEVSVSGEANDQFAFTDHSSFNRPGMREGMFPVKGGFEPERTLYICRATYGDSFHVGKVVAGNCNIGINGSEQVIPTYEVLFSYAR